MSTYVDLGHILPYIFFRYYNDGRMRLPCLNVFTLK